MENWKKTTNKQTKTKQTKNSMRNEKKKTKQKQTRITIAWDLWLYFLYIPKLTFTSYCISLLVNILKHCQIISMNLTIHYFLVTSRHLSSHKILWDQIIVSVSLGPHLTMLHHFILTSSALDFANCNCKVWVCISTDVE